MGRRAGRGRGAGPRSRALCAEGAGGGGGGLHALWLEQACGADHGSGGTGLMRPIGYGERTARLLGGIQRDASIIEVGPSYAPLAPKGEGWRTTVVDHDTAE